MTRTKHKHDNDKIIRGENPEGEMIESGVGEKTNVSDMSIFKLN